MLIKWHFLFPLMRTLTLFVGYTMAAKPIKFLELRYPMSQCLIIMINWTWRITPFICDTCVLLNADQNVVQKRPSKILFHASAMSVNHRKLLRPINLRKNYLRFDFKQRSYLLKLQFQKIIIIQEIAFSRHAL